MLFWCALLGGVWLHWQTALAARGTNHRFWSELWRYWSGQRGSAVLVFEEPADLAVGDPLFVRDRDSLRQVGEVQALLRVGKTIPDRRGRVTEARVMLYPSAPSLSQGAQAGYFETPDSLAWCVNALLPPERRIRIAAEVGRAMEDHRDEILAALRPVIEDSLRDGFELLEQDFPVVMERHRDELAAVAAKYQHEILDKELVPLVKTEIWPIVRRRAEPTVAGVGREMWQRVSLWRFGWRYAYDRSPFPDRQLVDQEWHRFLEQEAMPILVGHSEDFVSVVKEVIRDAAQNERVRAGLRASAWQVAADPELQAILWRLFDELIVDNPQLHEILERHWTGPEAERAFRVASERLEPTVRRIADLMFGTLEDGITPEFALVLRTQILAKDRRWLLLEDRAGAETLDRPSSMLRIQVRRGADLPQPPFPATPASARHEPGQ
jgi:hypothetical protein